MISGGGRVASQSIVANAATTTTPISQRTEILPISVLAKIFRRFNLKAQNSSVIRHDARASDKPHLSSAAQGCQRFIVS
jgi:hypothetical protein